ncbi:SMC family ATPase [Paenarthrobacter sp. DKR-5]|uniref:AAA family ATPase n=1 Tax=Paenarthrobacter sp. DKR-5 TaxID=2835535 RepID=UPI001BDDBB07|nr:SMC family ATPase [Paenarthrobacter sp. DKR-5]MBT1003161.1 SMC family ATPase [Paenarthrobacter sp. DKR-5]
MRIHRLEVQAFGPFAGRETVDFDELSEQGLFLLNGPTGAGKTSVLDAICYALYGSVPGFRQEGRRLRSDHADPATAPEVVCEFSTRGRRLRVTRNPAWERPKKRGDGTTTSQAKVLLQERVDGAWLPKSERNDEAGAEIEALLGMNREQFTKVVLLPQGDFAAFLRAKADERQKLLQQLFGSERYERLQEQLAADAAAARSRMGEAQRRLEAVLALAEHEAASVPAEGAAGEPARGLEEPAGPAESGGAAAAAGDPVASRERLDALLARVREEAAEAAGAVEALRSHAASCRAEADDLAALAARHGKLARAESLRAAVAAAAADQARRQQRLERHRAAEVLAGRIDVVDAAAEDLSGARAALADAEERVRAEQACPAAEAPAEELERGREAFAGEAAVLESMVPDEQTYLRLCGEADRLGASAAEAAAAGERHAEELQALGAAIAGLEETRNLLAELVRDLTPRRARAAAAQDVLGLVTSYREAVRTRLQREEEHRQAREAALTAKDTWLELLRGRLEQAAGELAGRLRDGEPCAVCGATEHPAPSLSKADGHAAVEAEDAARDAYDQAEAQSRAADERRGAAEREEAVLGARGGSADPAAAAAEAAAALRLVEEAEEAEQELARAEAELARLRTTSEQVRAAEAQSRHQAVEDAARAASSSAAAAELEEKLVAARDGFSSLAERAGELRRLASVLDGCLRARDRVRRAGEAARKAEAALSAALPASDFGTAGEARAALLAPAESAALQRACEAFETESTRAAVAFEDADVSTAAAEALAGVAVPDQVRLHAAEQRVAEAEGRLEQAALRGGLLDSAARRLAELRADFETAAAEAEPLIRRASLLAGLADTARGSRDNLRNMSLSTYVLAARLEEVAAAASLRLAAMSDGRYTLTHDDSKRGNAKSGLGLHVIDEWTGQERDTATLSGGESFMASLALALGLADVVQQEAGGVDIETLFVDEGFGSLDEEALEQVMDALEGLRDGGRVVGLVSHVAEMKLRISSQLRIVKGRHGSNVEFSRASLTSV